MKKYLKSLLLFFCFLNLVQAQKKDQVEAFDFKILKANLKILPEKGRVQGNVATTFDILKPEDSLVIDGRNMTFSNIQLNGKKVRYASDDKALYIISNFKPSENNELQFEYSVAPDKGMYFINWSDEFSEYSNKQVWTQGQGKYTSTWLPSFDDIREKVEFDLSYEFSKAYELISNGRLVSRRVLNDSVNVWEFDMDKPMSSYLVAFAAGKYHFKEITSSSGVPLKLYYQPEDSLNFEATYRHSAKIMDFLETETGVAYPWNEYKQIPVQDFLYAGMENTGTTIFSEALMTDAIGFNDRNYVNVNAHELAHQWFGNLVTAKNGTHHWLHEGFATYFALLAEKEIFGEEYYYWKLFESAERLQEMSDSGKGESLLDPNASSLTFYQKGAWVLHILREKIGDKAFRQGIKNFLTRYSYTNADTDQFIEIMEKSSGMDLSGFKNNWLKQSAFKSYAALESLKRSEFITAYLNIAALREIPLEDKYELLEEALSFPANDYIGQEVVNQLEGNLSESAMKLYELAFESNNIYIRQAIATSLREIPEKLKPNFISLLKDESYLTIEAALYKLWVQFPAERNDFLDETKDIEGFHNKNVRMLWLVLSLVTPDYEPERSKDFFKELSAYSEPWQAFEIRENAFGYLYQLEAFNEYSLKSLVLATNHHTYSFRNFSRKLLKELLKNEDYRSELKVIIDSMSDEESSYLRKII